MTALVLDGSGDGEAEVAIITQGLPHVFGWTKSATNGPTGGPLSLKLVWNDGYQHIATPEVLAAMETNLTGSNNDLSFEAKLPGTEGNSIQVEYVNTGVGSQPLEVLVSGAIITVRLGLSAGTKQVESLLVAEVPSASGDLPMTFTSALTGTIPFNVPVLLGDVELDLALKFKERMDLIGDITGHFDVAVLSDTVAVTAKASAANDATLEFGYADGSAVGMTSGTSADTTAGVAPAIQSTANQVEAAIEAHGDANALVTVTAKAGNDGTGVVTAMSAANLVDGANAVLTWEYPESPFLNEEGEVIEYDLSAEHSGGFEFKPVSSGRLVVSVAAGTAETVLFFNCAPAK